MRGRVQVPVVALALFVWIAGCTTEERDADLASPALARPSTSTSEAPAITTVGSSADQALVERFQEFARSPSREVATEVPLASSVALVLGVRSFGQVEDVPNAEDWVIGVDHYGGLVGPFSALDRAAITKPVEVLIGDHPHCASPPRPAPTPFAEHRRVSFQPRLDDNASCLEWWTVDLFVADDGSVEAVGLDLWEP